MKIGQSQLLKNFFVHKYFILFNLKENKKKFFYVDTNNYEHTLKWKILLLLLIFFYNS